MASQFGFSIEPVTLDAIKKSISIAENILWKGLEMNL